MKRLEILLLSCIMLCGMVIASEGDDLQKILSAIFYCEGCKRVCPPDHARRHERCLRKKDTSSGQKQNLKTQGSGEQGSK